METMLEGKRVVFAGARKLEEISVLIEKQGGIPVIRSMQGTVYLSEQLVEEDLRHLVASRADGHLIRSSWKIKYLCRVSASC